MIKFMIRRRKDLGVRTKMRTQHRGFNFLKVAFVDLFFYFH